MENEAMFGIESIAGINEGKVLGTKDQSEQRLLEFCFEDELKSSFQSENVLNCTYQKNCSY